MLAHIEREEKELQQVKLAQLGYYEEGLKTILDIRCSVFKPRAHREKLEAELIGSLSSTYLGRNGIVTYRALREASQYDQFFCNTDRETNGKLRQLYMTNWKLQLELEKLRRTLDRLKSAVKEEKG